MLIGNFYRSHLATYINGSDIAEAFALLYFKATDIHSDVTGFLHLECSKLNAHWFIAVELYLLFLAQEGNLNL